MVESLLYNGDKMKEVADGIRADLDEVQSLFSNEELLAEKISSISHTESKVVSWSKTNAFSIIPFYNELTGFKTGEILSKEPKKKVMHIAIFQMMAL